MIPYKDFYNRVFHIHYINYFEGGHQETHNHSKTERFSFILYLNDSDGETVFEEPIFKKIKPTKGLLVLFKADFLHCAEKSFNNKKILVGAIDRI